MTALRAADVRRLAIGGSLLLGARVALRVLEWVFATRPLIPVVFGAVALDYWSQRLGARWTAVAERAPTHRSRVALVRAFAFGFALAVLVLAAAMALGRARVSRGGFSWIGAGFGGLRAGARALLDELIFRGIPLAICRPVIASRHAIAFVSALGIAPLLLLAPFRVETVLLALAAGCFFALTWEDGGGGVEAWVTHVGWLVAVDVAFQGALVDVEWVDGALVSTNEASGVPAWLGAGAFAAATLIRFGRRRAEPR